jgi:hypothetical protein
MLPRISAAAPVLVLFGWFGNSRCHELGNGPSDCITLLPNVTTESSRSGHDLASAARSWP